MILPRDKNENFDKLRKFQTLTAEEFDNSQITEKLNDILEAVEDSRKFIIGFFYILMFAIGLCIGTVLFMM